MQFISRHWTDVAGDPDSRPMQGLPDSFWMNSIGGKAGKGFWVTTLMYTEDESYANTFKDILMKWQSKGMEKTKTPDLIQIGKKK